jgi:hypothetical protein
MSADVQYTFEVDGRTYQNSRVLFGGNLTLNMGIARDRVEEYPVGREVDVYYNPRNPAHATLLRKASWYLIVAVLLGLCVLMLLLNALIFGE